MPKQGRVNYLTHKPERQAFHIDAGGVFGKLVSPELQKTTISLRDMRQETVEFAADSIGFLNTPSQVADFEADGWQETYDTELTSLLTTQIGAQEVIIFDHTVRVDDPNAQRRPARNVHSDYSKDGAESRLVDLLGAEQAAHWSKGHYGFVNIWRPVTDPINSAPLGFVHPNSVAEADWLLVDLIYPDRRGSIMGLAANPEHDWIYWPKMTPDEVAFFNIYDNQGLPSIAHSAVDRVEDPSITTIRKSIESRALVRYAD